MIEELSVYKRIDGHYRCFVLDNEKMINDTVEWENDAKNHRLIVKTKGVEVSFVIDTYDIAESGEVKIVSGMVMGFAVVGDKISTDIGLHICASESNIPVDTITLSMDIGFDNGEISWSEPEFMLGWE